MRKINEALRLRYELDLDRRQIARSRSISVSTVHEYLRRAETAGVGWPFPAEWNDTQLQAALFPATATPIRPCKDTLDFEEIQRQLRSNRHVTLQLFGGSTGPRTRTATAAAATASCSSARAKCKTR